MTRLPLPAGLALAVPLLLLQAAAARGDDKPPRRVLLFTSAASREYQFLLRHLQRQEADKRVEVAVCVQSAAAEHNRVLGVPEERCLDDFPATMRADKPEDARAAHAALGRYDLVIALDPDWTKLTAKQTALLRRWVEDGGGLIFVAGPVYTGRLGRPKPDEALTPLLELLPVVLQDERIAPDRDASKPCRLRFGDAEEGGPTLRLKADAREPLAGWDEFFGGARGEAPERGFYGFYPVKQLKANARVLAALDDPAAKLPDGREQPYLAVRPVGKGKVVYLGSGETWRLRAYRTEAYELFWTELGRYAARR